MDTLRHTWLDQLRPCTDKELLAELALRRRSAEVSEGLWGWRIHPQHLGALAPAELMRRTRPGRSARLPVMRKISRRSAAWVPFGPVGMATCLVAMARRGLVASGARPWL